MKKQILILAMTLFTFGMYAQEDNTEVTDTTKIEMGNKTILILNTGELNEVTDTINLEELDCDDSTEDLTHWAGIDLGVNMLLNPDNSLPTSSDSTYLDLDYARSLSWNFNLFEKKIKIVDNYVGIITGLSWSFNSYGLQNNVDMASNILVSTLDAAGDSTIINLDSTSFSQFSGRGYTYSKNKFRTTSLKIPLLLEFNTNNIDNDKCFHVAAGVVGGWTYRAKHIKKYTIDKGNEFKETETDDFNVNKFTLDAQARIGYRDFTLFANYALTPLFEDNKGPEVYPLTIGLSILPF